MAINPETQYPGKIAPSTPDYPYGAARNITVPGDGTGTPWEAALVNDLFGFQQALLSAAALVPSGSPDKVGASQYLNALLKLTGASFISFSALASATHLKDGDRAIVTGEAVTVYEITSTATSNAVAGGLFAKAVPLNGKYACSSVQNLEALTDPNGALIDFEEGDLVSTGVTDWRVVASGSGDLAIGPNDAIPLNGAWLQDWGTDVTGTVAADTEVAAAIALNKAVILPTGKTRIDSKKTVGTNTRFRGHGPDCAIDAQMSDVLFEFPRETGRSVKAWRGFNVISTGNTMTNGVAFLIPGTEVGGVLKYTSGWKFEDIEVGGGGEFGCIWDISDTFRFTARDCGYTSVTNPIRIRGSVVQCTIDNVTGNNTDYVRSYDGENAGVFMQTRNDYSDALTRVPENVKVLNSGFVNHRRGVNSVGLAIQTINCDLDFIRDVGWEYGGGDGHTLKGGYIAHTGQDIEFIGIRSRRAQDLDAVEIEDVTINAYAVVASKQTAVQVGDGDAAPFAEPAGVSVTGVKIFGPAGAWDFGIQADRCRSVEINGNKFKAGVIKAGGKAINASNSKNLTCNGNKCRQQEIYITAPDATATITAVDNDADVQTAFIAPPAAQVEIARNRNQAN